MSSLFDLLPSVVVVTAIALYGANFLWTLGHSFTATGLAFMLAAGAISVSKTSSAALTWAISGLIVAIAPWAVRMLHRLYADQHEP